jgi:hypothetical protein
MVVAVQLQAGVPALQVVVPPGITAGMPFVVQVPAVPDADANPDAKKAAPTPDLPEVHDDLIGDLIGDQIGRLLRDAKRRLQICKIITVGDGRAGKTCLLGRLRGAEFNPEQESTCGVEEVKVKVRPEAWEATEGGAALGTFEDQLAVAVVQSEAAHEAEAEEPPPAAAAAAAEGALEPEPEPEERADAPLQITTDAPAVVTKDGES